jgi:hypothetical protein
MRPGKRRTLDKASAMGALLDRIEHLKASVRAKVEHPFRVIKRQLGHRGFICWQSAHQAALPRGFWTPSLKAG